MKPKLYLFIILTSSVLALSCRTAKKMYEKGNYDEAVELAAKKLQKNPDDPKLIAIIREAYSFAENDHQANIRSFSQSENELKWEWIYNEYAALQKMYDAIFRVPEIFRLIHPTDYNSSLAVYAGKAGQVRFDRGNYFMSLHDKRSYRNAYYEFQRALFFMPGHRDAISGMEEAYVLGVTNVIVHPVHQYGGYVYSGYTPGGMNIDDQIIQNLKFNSGNDFVKVYSAWDARGRDIRPDVELEIRLSRVDIGRPHEIRDRKRVSREVVVKETVIRPDSIVREYATVHADIISIRRTLHSEVLLEVNARDDRGGWMWSDHFPASQSWSTESVTFTGDQRALSDADRSRISSGSQTPPHVEEITRTLIDRASNDAVHRIRSFLTEL